MLKQYKSGFTLIEIIIAFALVAVVLGIVGSIFITGIKVFSNSDVKSTLQMEGQTVQEQLGNIGMQASDIEQVTLKDGSVKNATHLNDITIPSDATQVVINLRNDNMTEKPYTFTLSGKELTMTANGGTFRTISTKVSSFKILPIEDKGIRFELELQHNSGFSDLVTYPVNVEATFRNRKAVN